MAAVSSFDQWQKDVFFPAAEEVQESADKMESVYRLWIRNHKDELQSEDSEELLRELQATLGTAKWQLEEFERAVELSRDSLLHEKNTVSRRRHFMSAIRNQILHIEQELSDSFAGAQPLRWVKLDQEEVDDLAIFLSGSPEQRAKRSIKDGSLSPLKRDPELRTIASNKNENCVEASPTKPSTISDKKVPRESEQLNQQKCDLATPDIGDWRIVIADREEADLRAIEARQGLVKRGSDLLSLSGNIISSAKLKWFCNSYLKAKSEEHIPLRSRFSKHLHFERVTQLASGIDKLTDRSKNYFCSFKEGYRVSTPQLLNGRIGGLHKYLQGSKYYNLFGRPLRFTLLLVLSLFLVVPFVLCSI